MALAYGFSWAYWLPLIAADRTVSPASAASTHFPGLLGPLLAALLVTVLTRGGAGVRDLGSRMLRWRVAARWYLIAASPVAVFAVAAVVVAASGRPLPLLADLGVFSGLPPLTAPVVWLVVFLINGFGEETGWRGFALPRLQESRSPLPATLAVAGVWALWHLPLFFLLQTYQGFSPVALPGFVLGLACGAVVLTWLYNGSGGSVLICAAWHATYNLTVATAAGQGVIAALATAVVMVWAGVLVVLELRARRRGRPSVLGSRRPRPTTAARPHPRTSTASSGRDGGSR